MRVRSCCRSSVLCQPDADRPVAGRVGALARVDRVGHGLAPARVHRHVAEALRSSDPGQGTRERPDAPRIAGADGAAGRIADAERGRAEPPDEELDAGRAGTRVHHDTSRPPAIGGLHPCPSGELQIAAERGLADELVPGGVVDPQSVEIGAGSIGGHIRSMALEPGDRPTPGPRPPTPGGQRPADAADTPLVVSLADSVSALTSRVLT